VSIWCKKSTNNPSSSLRQRYNDPLYRCSGNTKGSRLFPVQGSSVGLSPSLSRVLENLRVWHLMRHAAHLDSWSMDDPGQVEPLMTVTQGSQAQTWYTGLPGTLCGLHSSSALSWRWYLKNQREEGGVCRLLVLSAFNTTTLLWLECLSVSELIWQHWGIGPCRGV
jgi:hypothetical protein